MELRNLGSFYHLGENMIKAEFADNWSQIVFRVKPAADGPDYREKFLREIAPKLDTDNAFVADAAPYTEQQLQFEVMNGDTDKVNSRAVVVLFLLVNVFFGVNRHLLVPYSPPPFGDSSTDGDGQYAWRCVSFTDR